MSGGREKFVCGGHSQEPVHKGDGALGASKIPQLFVWISLQAYPIPLGYIKADIKF